MTKSVSDVQLLLLRMPCFHWINIEQLWALWKLSNSSVNHALVTTRHLQDKFRLENLSWRLWYRRQQKAVTYQPLIAEDTTKVPTTPASCNKFFMTMDDEEEEDDCYSTSSSLSLSSEDEWYSQQNEEIAEDLEDDLVFEKKRDHDNHLYFTTTAATTTTNKQPISLLTQLLQNPTTQQQQVPQVQEKKQLLKRCQSRYQSLDEWFATSS